MPVLPACQPDCLANQTKLSLFGRRYRKLAKFCQFEEYLANPWKKKLEFEYEYDILNVQLGLTPGGSSQYT
jgi:hypothetical protein